MFLVLGVAVLQWLCAIIAHLLSLPLTHPLTVLYILAATNFLHYDNIFSAVNEAIDRAGKQPSCLFVSALISTRFIKRIHSCQTPFCGRLNPLFRRSISIPRVHWSTRCSRSNICHGIRISQTPCAVLLLRHGYEGKSSYRYHRYGYGYINRFKYNMDIDL